MQRIPDKSVGGEVYTAVLVPLFVAWHSWGLINFYVRQERAYVRKIYVRK